MSRLDLTREKGWRRIELIQAIFGRHVRGECLCGLPLKQQLRGGGKEVCLICELATVRFIGHCRGDGGDFFAKQVQAAKVRLAARLPLRLLFARPFLTSKFDDFSRAPGRTPPDHGQTEIIPRLHSFKS